MGNPGLRFEFVRLLAFAAEAGRLRWDPQRPTDDVYTCRSVADGRRYEFRWKWWYGEDGSTLDRQAAEVASDEVAVASAWGTEGHDHALRLLSTSTPGWREHVHRMIEPPGPPPPPMEPTMTEPPSVSAAWNTLALTIRDASRAGLLRWEPVAPPDREGYAARSPGAAFDHVVEILRPVDQDGEALGVMAVRVTGPGVNATFAAGTEGMELIREAVAASLPEQAAALAAEREALEAECRRLRAQLG